MAESVSSRSAADWDAPVPAVTNPVVVLGGGLMGGALVRGLIANGWQRVTVVEPRPERRAELAEIAGLTVAADPAESIPAAELVCLAVKPKDVKVALAEVSAVLPAGCCVVSMCAGVDLATLAAALPAGTPIVRVMPNIAARIGKGMTVISAASGVGSTQLQLVGDLVGALGRTMILPEPLQDAATAVSGSGPAYVFYLAEAMIEAGVQQGLTRAQASDLVVSTFAGAAALLAEGTHPTLLREAVTSPGGTTAAAIRQLDAHGVRSAVADAMWAAHDRSRAG